jgi:hypothetical protein
VYADDIDGDGDIDVLCTVCLVDQVFWFENDGSETFTQHVVGSSFFRPHMVRSADLDDDNDTDVIGAAINSNEIAWWENDGNVPVQWTKHTITNVFTGATGIDLKDVDGDTDLDVLGAAQFANSIRWWENINVAVDEGKRTLVDYEDALPTIVRGPLPAAIVSTHQIFDITGREVHSANPRPGIYFIEIEGTKTYKIIKVK